MRGPALASVVRPVVIVGGHIRPHGSDRVAELSYGGIEPACMVGFDADHGDGTAQKVPAGEDPTDEGEDVVGRRGARAA